jgi:zinc protease
MTALCLFLCLVCVPSAFAKAPDLGPFPPLRFQVPRPVTAVLSSGATVYILEDHELPLFSVSVLIRTGSLFDPPQKIGLGEVFAEVFRTGGTKSMPPEALNRELELMAASLEAGMNPEEMTVGLSALSRDFDRVMEIFQDVMRRPAFRREAFSLEKAKMIEGIRRRNDDPGNLARRTFRKLFYGKTHPRGWEPELSTVQPITRDDLFKFYGAYFHPDRMIFAVSGDIRAKEVIRRLESLLNGLGASPEGPPPSLPPPPHPAPGLNSLEKDINQSQIIMGGPGIERRSPDHFAMGVADYIIGGGASSRFFTEIRSRQGLAYSVESFSSEHAETGVVGAACETKAQSTVQAIRSIRRILRESLRDGVSGAELGFAKESLVNSFVFQFTSPDQIAGAFARLSFQGYPPDYLETYTSRLELVSGTDVLRVLRSYWDPDRMTALVVGHESGFGEKLEELGPVRRIQPEP